MISLALAMVLDAIFGEPRVLWDRVPHPAVLIGRAIGWADARFNTGTNRRAKGIALTAALVIGGWLTGSLIAALPLGWLWQAIAAAVLLAQRSLSDHVSDVASALRLSLDEGRSAVARIVGRDTTDMDEPAVARAAIESAAENLSDGVIAPAFWFIVAGLPGMLAYKAVNTADSMVGYLTPRHAEFGWASARLDDVLNWIPARLTAFVAAIATRTHGAGAIIRRDAPLHRSPNAGWPEAAFAAALNIALAGPRSYSGQMKNFPFVNTAGRRDAGPDDIDRAVRLMWKVWALVLCLVILLAVV